MSLRETRKGVCCDGFVASGARKGKYGVALIAADEPAVAVGVFTRNAVKAACVRMTRKVVENRISLIVANSGNANACTKTGLDDAKRVRAEAAQIMGFTPSSVAVASTGIIGRRLNAGLVVELARKARRKLGRTGASSLSAARALMTTDTKPKQFSVKYKGIQVGGVCKGVGMVAPEMATVLCFLTTNARLDKGELKTALRKSVDKSFNMVSVDGEESTNDMVLLLSSGIVECSAGDFQKALDHVTVNLARMIAGDGEGARKLMEVEVIGAKNEKIARNIVHTILSSPLVKTAVGGGNPNWGRIMARLGSTTKVDEKRVDVYFESKRGKTKIVSAGVSTGRESKAADILKAGEVRITVNLNSGRGSAVGWGCDLTQEYVKINAEYN